MWTTKAKRKNYYIHSIFPETDPIILNNFVEKAIKRTQGEKDPIATNVQSRCLNSPSDPATYNMAYGLLGLKKLIVDISSSNLEVNIKLLKMLSEELKNKENCFRAMNDYDIVRRLSCLTSNFYEEDMAKFEGHIQQTLEILETLSMHYAAAIMIFQDEDLMKMLLEFISCNEFDRKSLKILLELSNHSEIAEKMIEENFLSKLKNILIANESLLDAYEILINLVQCNSNKTIEEDLFDFLYERIFVEQRSQPVIMKCFGILINNCEAQKLCDHKDVVYKLYETLKDENLDLKTAEYATLALQNSTLSTSSLWRCREFWDLPEILIRLAYNKESDRLQLFSFQTLRQITQLPCIKDYVRKACKKKIKNIYCRTKYCKDAKDKLLEWLRRKRYINKESESDTEDYVEFDSEPPDESDFSDCDAKFRI